MHTEIQNYNSSLEGEERKICDLLLSELSKQLPESEAKIWHGHPVWFIDGNPVTGYSKRNAGIKLLFWSGQSFDEYSLKNDGKFKAASITYTSENQLNIEDLHRWLEKCRDIQWDYKNIVKRKGVLERLK